MKAFGQVGFEKIRCAFFGFPSSDCRVHGTCYAALLNSPDKLDVDFKV
jgi:hypothetical protein